MTAPTYDGEQLCDGAHCDNLARVKLRGDGGDWCRTCEPKARAAFEKLCAERKPAEPPPRPCAHCEAPGRPYLTGPACDLHSPAALRARGRSELAARFVTRPVSS